MLSDTTKLNFSYKKWSAREHTDNNKAWYEEFPGSSIKIHANNVWVDAIPATPPGSTSPPVEVLTSVELTEDNSVGQHRCWKYCTTPGDLNTQVGDFIHPRFGAGYAVRVFDDNGIEITSSDSSNWLFDYENGVLTFENDPTSNGYVLPLRLTGYRYVGQTLALSFSGASRRVVIDKVFFPSTMQLVYPATNIQTFIPLRRYLRQAFESPVGATGHNIGYYFSWDLVGSVSGAFTNQHFETLTDLANFLDNNFQNNGSYFTEDISITVYLEVDTSIDPIPGLMAYNSFYSALHARPTYGAASNPSKAILSCHWSYFNNWVRDLTNMMFGFDLTATHPNFSRCFWLCGKPHLLYKLPKLGITKNLSGANFNKSAFDPSTGAEVSRPYNYAVLDDFVVSGMEYGGGWYTFDEISPMYSWVVVFRQSLTTPTGNAISFYVKPIGQDTFNINYTDNAANYMLAVVGQYGNSYSMFAKFFEPSVSAGVNRSFTFSLSDLYRYPNVSTLYDIKLKLAFLDITTNKISELSDFTIVGKGKSYGGVPYVTVE